MTMCMRDKTTDPRKHGLAAVLAVLALVFVSSGLAGAVDFWVAATDAAVATNNDCGYIASVHGAAAIRRSFHNENETVAAHVADRVNSGDELVAPSGARIEMASGNNVILVVGSGGRARLSGLRSFLDPSGRTVTRLDLDVVSGEVRVQVRLNEQKPDAVLAGLNGADVLVRRGDAVLQSGESWRVSVVAGEVRGRNRRSGVTGAPFTLSPMQVAGGNGAENLPEQALRGIVERLPFSFESMRAALPPMPSLGWQLEAP